MGISETDYDTRKLRITVARKICHNLWISEADYDALNLCTAVRAICHNLVKFGERLWRPKITCGCPKNLSPNCEFLPSKKGKSCGKQSIRTPVKRVTAEKISVRKLKTRRKIPFGARKMCQGRNIFLRKKKKSGGKFDWHAWKKPYCYENLCQKIENLKNIKRLVRP